MAQFCKNCIKKYIGNKKNKNYDEWLVKDYGLCEGCGYEYLKLKKEKEKNKNGKD